MCCVWGMAQSVNTKIWANRQRSEGCWLALLCCCLAWGSLCSGHSPGQRVTCGGFWRRRRRKGKARADSAVQLMPVPAGCLGKPGQRLLVFWGRNRFGWNQIKLLAFFKQKHVTFLGFIYVVTKAMACFCPVPIPGVPPHFSCVLDQFWIFIHCFETPSFPVKEMKPRVYSWILSQVTRHKQPVIQPSSLQASRSV